MSRRYLPPSVLTTAKTARASPTTPASTAHHQWPRKSVMASRARVLHGSLAGCPSGVVRLAKKTLNRGSTTTASTTTVMTAATVIIAG